MRISEFIEKLKCDRNLSDDEFKMLLESDAFDEYLTERPLKNVGAFMAMKSIFEG